MPLHRGQRTLSTQQADVWTVGALVPMQHKVRTPVYLKVDPVSALARAASGKEMTCNLRTPLSFCVALCCLQSCDGGAGAGVAGACVGESSMSWQSASMSLQGVRECVKYGVSLTLIATSIGPYKAAANAGAHEGQMHAH